MNSLYIIILLILILSIPVAYTIYLLKKKRILKDKFIRDFDFNKNDFKLIKDGKEYERKTSSGTEFICISEDKNYLKIIIGINFIPKTKYKDLSFFKHLKYTYRFSRKFKKENYFLSGQNQSFITNEIVIKKESDILNSDEVNNIISKLYKVLKFEGISQ